jgi:hypothetical protein
LKANSRSAAILILILLASSALGSEPAASGEQTALPDQGMSVKVGEYGPEYNGEDLTRPESKFQFRLEDTSSGTTSKINTFTMYLQPQGVFALPYGWGFAWLAQVPFLAKPVTPSGSSDAIEELGLGDIELQAALIHPINARWAYGFGARFVSPTAQDTLGNGKWQVMPVMGIRYSFLEFGPNTYFVPQFRYAVSFGGDPSRKNISEPEFAPTLSIGLPDRWFVILYPSFDIRINYGDPSSGQTGRLFFPIDALVGRKFSDNVVVSLEIGVPVIKDYPVYNFKSEFKISAKF